MINRIGLIYQDVYSYGFLQGLKARLGCEAELLPAPAGVGRSRTMTRRQARQAWEFFQHRAVDAVVRFTDADRGRWQDVKRDEQAVFPEELREICVYGVAVNNPEEWLARAPRYLAGELGIDEQALRHEPDKASMIKGAVDRNRGSLERSSDVVVRLVSQAPSEVFRQWLADDSFRSFYQECRQIAARFECETTNEL